MTDVTLHVAPNYTTYKQGPDVKGVDQLISDTLAYRPPGYFFSKKFKEGFWDGYIRFAKDRQFPTGLLMDVIIALRTQDYIYTLENAIKPLDVGDIPGSIDLHHEGLPNNILTLRDYQYNSVVSALENRRGIVNVATNGGKTEIACGIIKVLLPRLSEEENIVFFTHSTEIATQSKKRIEERLQEPVGFIGKGEWNTERVTVVMIPTLNKHIKEPNKSNIRYTKEMKAIKKLLGVTSGAILKTADDNLETMAKVAEVLMSAESEENYDTIAIDLATELSQERQTSLEVYEGVKELKERLRAFEKDKLGVKMEKYLKARALLDNCRCFIADEAHHSSSTTWYETFMSMENAEFRLGLTGTVEEKEDPVTHARFVGATGDKISEISNDFLIENNYSARPTIYAERIIKPSPLVADGYQDAYALGIVENKFRNETIAKRVAERYKEGKTCLIIVTRTLHGELLEERLTSMGVQCEFIHGSRTTEDRQDALNRTADGSLKVLIATTILDEGVDVSGINCIWMAAAGKSYKQTLQRVGRGLRKKKDGSGLEVYDFKDETNEYLSKHSQTRFDYYEAEKFEIVNLN